MREIDVDNKRDMSVQQQLDSKKHQARFDRNSIWDFPTEKFVILNQPNRVFDELTNFKLNRLKLGPLIDEGAFGRVYMAEAYGIQLGQYKTIVAVKTLKGSNKAIKIGLQVANWAILSF